jgi:cell division protein FtsZ
LDFADIRSVMSEMGTAMMGTGEAEGERRALDAAEAAISNPLLDDVSLKGAKGVLINITGGYDMTLYEVDEAANRIRDEIETDTANIIFGSTFDARLEGKMCVSVVATGIGGQPYVSTISAVVAEAKPAPIKTVEQAVAESEEEENDAEPAIHELVTEEKALPQAKSRTGSIFERLPGLGRFRHDATKEEAVNHDNLDIPAFLRKGG